MTVKNGQPYPVTAPGTPNPPPWPEAGRVQIIFYQVSGPDDRLVDDQGGELPHEAFQTAVNDDGTFEVIGPTGKGIPPGKYRIVVKHKDFKTETDLLKGAYDEARSKINRDVTEGQEIVIDVGKPTG